MGTASSKAHKSATSANNKQTQNTTSPSKNATTSSQQEADQEHSNDKMVSISNTLALGAGCYWGTEKFIVKDFQKQFPNAIKMAKVGFMSAVPDNPIPNPNYRQVCSGRTGYVEVLFVELNDPATTFEPLVRFFFQFHDPTTKDRQGNDTGTQYASAIFCSDDEQKKIATKVKGELQQLMDQGKVKQYAGKTVETAILSSNPFVEAHAEHQEYLAKNPLGYCNHAIRFKTWPTLN